MTRKHFRMLAEHLRLHCRPFMPDRAFHELVHRLADDLGRTNKSFDLGRFVNACYLPRNAERIAL